jgi:cyclic pyranopterin phosphate synthase
MREASPTALIDACNRRLTYLRISITDRCNLRCAYCLPFEDTPRLDHAQVLRYEEILRIARVGARLGISKLRVTGGEPLVRKGVYDFLAELSRIPGIRDLSLTTNGVLLEENIDRIQAAGVTRINVSLDTLQPDRYREITGTDAFARVWAGIRAAQAAGFHPIKINVVALSGVHAHRPIPNGRAAAVARARDPRPARRSRGSGSGGTCGDGRPGPALPV